MHSQGSLKFEEHWRRVLFVVGGATEKKHNSIKIVFGDLRFLQRLMVMLLFSENSRWEFMLLPMLFLIELNFMPKLPHRWHENFEVAPPESLGFSKKCTRNCKLYGMPSAASGKVAQRELRSASNSNFLADDMKTQMCFNLRLPHENLDHKLPHPWHENLDVIEAQTSSRKVRETSCASSWNLLNKT
jgi:hypothetical protein